MSRPGTTTRRDLPRAGVRLVMLIVLTAVPTLAAVDQVQRSGVAEGQWLTSHVDDETQEDGG